MKHLRISLVIAVVLAAASITVSQQRGYDTSNLKTVIEKNPFLVGKRHGAVLSYSYSIRKQPDDLTAELDQFLIGKGHGIMYTTGNSSNAILDNANLVDDLNPFLVDKRHGSVFKTNKNIIYVTTNDQQKPKDIFLEQKRHR